MTTIIYPADNVRQFRRLTPPRGARHRGAYMHPACVWAIGSNCSQATICLCKTNRGFEANTCVNSLPNVRKCCPKNVCLFRTKTPNPAADLRMVVLYTFP